MSQSLKFAPTTTSTKRRALTTDELMRTLEEPHRKRARLSSITGTSVTSNPNSHHRDYSGEEDNSTGSFEGESSGASEDEGDQFSIDLDLDSEFLSHPELPSRFAFSRDRDTTQHPNPHLFKPTPTSFSSMDISPPLQAALNNMSIRTPTEVQAACIPPLLSGESVCDLSEESSWMLTCIEGRDCIGNAKTGSGKTIAFALPILQQLSVDPYGIFALILTPTRYILLPSHPSLVLTCSMINRELAFQISEQFAVLGSSLNIRTAIIVGGMDMMAQALELGNRPHVVVATPGRIVDHLRSGSGEWNLSRVKFLVVTRFVPLFSARLLIFLISKVLDEADRLLTSTFAQDLSYLFGVLPKERQTCLFTATLTPSIDILATSPPRPGREKPFIHRMKER